MTVIAKKIAAARSARSQQGDDARPDAAALADPLVEALTRMLCGWLGVDELDGLTVSTRWSGRDDLTLPDVLMTRQGRSRADRAVFAMPESLALSAVGTMLRIDATGDASLAETLRPFLSEAVLTLGDTLDRIGPLTALGSGRAGWTMVTSEEVAPLLGEDDLLRLSLSFVGANDERVETVLVLTPALIRPDTEAEDVAPAAPVKTSPPPRLGPCQVEVQAIADRIRMSVADCTRLELGQVVALPGLRFDNLELTVEMGDGPVALADASLGADKGVKAVRLNRGLDPEFKVPPPDLAPSDPPGGPMSGKDTVDA